VKKTVLVFRHVPHEGVGELAGAFRRARLPLRYVDAWKRGALPPPKDVAALVVMGGPMGVYEKNKYPFLKKEVAYLRRFLKTGKPVLGICLGSQLLAHALGRRVYPNKAKEIGWYTVRLTPAGRRNPFLKKAPAAPWVFQWHGDTFDLPRGAQLLATSSLCRRQAFRWRDNVYGLQFHPEVTPAMVREWRAQPGASEEEKAGNGNFRPRFRRMQAWARPFFDGFARLAATGGHLIR